METNEEAAPSPGANQSLGGGRGMGKTERNPMTWQKLPNRLFKGASLGPVAIYHPPAPFPLPQRRKCGQGSMTFP